MDSSKIFLLVLFLFAYLFCLGTTQEICKNVTHNFPPYLFVCADGMVIRGGYTIKHTPPHLDLPTNVRSKDVMYSSQINQSARIFLPMNITKTQGQKLPLIVYYHGGGFILGYFNNPPYHNLTNKLSAGANAIVVSVDYRLAPENALPAGFNDSWTAFQWVASHANGTGSEEWLNLYADFDKVFLMGDSAGATIAINIAMKYGEDKLKSVVNVRGMILVMPFFINLVNFTSQDQKFFKSIPLAEYFGIVYPTALGTDNLLLNPADDPNLGNITCPNVAVVVAELDDLIGVQLGFLDKLEKSSWKGKSEVIEIKGEGHMFNLNPANSEKAKPMFQQIYNLILSWAA